MAAKIHLERMLLRDAVAVPGESALNYLLVRLIPAGAEAGGGAEAMPLNVALVLDVSGSMYSEDRLKNVQAAAIRALELLKPSDMVSVVAFGADAKAVLPASPAKNKDRIKKCINEIDSFEVNAAGTSMHLGIQEGLAQIRASAAPGRFSRVVVLTDGQTSGESVCRQIVADESAGGVTFSAMGVGTDWNENLLKDLSGAGRGTGTTSTRPTRPRKCSATSSSRWPIPPSPMSGSPSAAPKTCRSARPARLCPSARNCRCKPATSGSGSSTWAPCRTIRRGRSCSTCSFPAGPTGNT
jgi:hypothetical protein